MSTQTATQSQADSSAPTKLANPIRIYVACLAAYNNGILHGRWIDAAQGVDHIWDETRAMLSASPIKEAEEWAIHDHEGLEGAPLSEWTDFAKVADLADFIQEHGALGGELVLHFGGTLSDEKAALENYSGQYDSLEDFARNLTEDTGPSIPEPLARYIDYAAMGRDMEMSGDIFTLESDWNEIHVFWSR